MNAPSFRPFVRQQPRPSTVKRLFNAGCIVLPLAGLLPACVVVEGNGQIEAQDRALDGFTSVAANAFLDTTITIGTPFEVVVGCDSNLVDAVETVVEDNTLTISTPGDQRFSTNLDCVTTVVMPVLVGVTNGGSGNLTSEDRLDDLERVGNSGSGDLSLSGSVQSEGTLTTSNSGSGNTTVLGILVGTLDEVNSGTGKTTFAGVAGDASVQCSGSGSIDASELVTRDVIIKSTGSGDVTVTATDSVDVTLSGSGDVDVLGNPTERTTNATGSGQVTFR